MIEVFYSGHGYALRVGKDRQIDSQLKSDTINEYHAWFCIDSGIAERLKHFDNYELRELCFIEGNLPRGITQEQALGSEFAITRRDGCWHSQFKLE
ncbi:MAG: hypothetical protein PHQ03_04955 [Methylococcales bacterium]|nr:hypothetical protein [Methylococcales bacterium]